MIREVLLSAALLGCSQHREPAPTTAPAPSASLVAISHKERDRLALAVKDEAIRRCEVGGGIVAMGFGYHVVCLKPQSVEWVRDPHFPEDE
jgi:hypothetical protein